METLPFVSVVIPVHNAEKTLEACLRSLASLDYPEDRLEILLLENGSTDTSKKILENSGFSFLSLARRGAARALNAGINRAKGEIVAFTHADCVVDPQWLRHLASAFKDSQVMGVGGRVVNAPSQTWAQRYSEKRAFDFQNGNIAKGISFLPWINIVNGAFKKILFDQIGLFDEAFQHEYEIDLSWRAVLEHQALSYEPKAVVMHSHRENLFQLCKRYFHIASMAPLFERKYGVLFTSLYFVPHKSPFALLTKFTFKKAGVFSLVDALVGAAFYLGSLRGAVSRNLEIRALSPQLKNRVVELRNGENIYLFLPTKKTFFKLEGIGTEVWTLFRSGLSSLEITHRISSLYRKSISEIEGDVTRFINQLEALC